MSNRKKEAFRLQHALDVEHYQRDFINKLYNTDYTTKRGVEEYAKYMNGNVL